MKTLNNIIPIIAILFSNLIGFSQEQVTIKEEKEITINLPKDYSKTLNLFIFPKENQDTLEQTNDMKECYVWAYRQTNFDPLNPTKVEVKPVSKIQKGLPLSVLHVELQQEQLSGLLLEIWVMEPQLVQLTE